MAAITATSMQGQGSRQITITTLSASDTLTYKPGVNATLVLNNVTAGALTPLIDGDGATTVSFPGLGSPIDTSAGFTVPSIGAGEYHAIPLDTISQYLKGVITVTGGDGIEASLLEY